MPVNIQIVGTNYIVKAYDGLDVTDMLQIDDTIQQAIRLQHAYLWIDCESLLTISTAALRMILADLGKLENAGMKLLLYKVQTPVLEILNTSGLDTVLTIVPSIKEAYIYCKAF